MTDLGLSPPAWKLIELGNTEFPKLYDFTDEQRNRPAIRELAAAPRTHLIQGNGPPAYEEAHRQFSTWRCESTRALTGAGVFRRYKSARDVEKLREWTLALLEVCLDPSVYLATFAASASRMKVFNVGKLSVAYVLADSTKEDTILRALAERKTRRSGQADRTHSYEGREIDPRVTKVLEAAGVDASDPKLVASMLEAAKLMARGKRGFIPTNLRAGANALRELVGS